MSAVSAELAVSYADGSLAYHDMNEDNVIDVNELEESMWQWNVLAMRKQELSQVARTATTQAEARKSLVEIETRYLQNYACQSPSSSSAACSHLERITAGEFKDAVPQHLALFNHGDGSEEEEEAFDGVDGDELESMFRGDRGEL